MIDSSGTLKFSDTTLRDGEQAPGVVFSLADKLRLAAALNVFGVDEAEVGSAAMGADELAGLRVLAGQGFSMRLSCWCRAQEEDVFYAVKAGIRTVNISFPVSDRLLASMDRCRDWVRHHVDSVLAFAAQIGCAYSVGLQDAARADPVFLDEIVRMIRERGAFRIRLADSAGVLHPFTAAALVTRVKAAAGGMAISFHAHNDLGMAVANTLAAAQAGADTLDCTVNGLGERAGNCPLEELLFALRYAAEVPLQWDAGKLMTLCGLTTEASGRPVPPAKPVTGAMAVCHESGIHVRSLLKDPLAYAAYPPSAAGRESHQFTLGKHSGAAGVKDFFSSHGIALRYDEVHRLTEVIRQESRRLKRDLEEHEVLELYKPVFDAVFDARNIKAG